MFLYWRGIFTDLNETYGWTDAYIWTLTEGEIYGKIWEIRKRNISKAVTEYIKYGDAGLAEIVKLDVYDPVRVAYEKRIMKKEEKECVFDKMMIKRVEKMFENLEKTKVN